MERKRQGPRALNRAIESGPSGLKPMRPNQSPNRGPPNRGPPIRVNIRGPPNRAMRPSAMRPSTMRPSTMRPQPETAEIRQEN